MKKNIQIAIIAVVFALLAGCESCARCSKSMQSDFGGGLPRTCRVYSLDGTLIKEYKGTFDIQSSQFKVYFDLNGKRTQIYNAMVLCDEE